MSQSRSCIALVSGGLDSLLAVRIMVLQGIRVIAYHGNTVFHGKIITDDDIARENEAMAHRLRKLGVSDVIFHDQSDAMVDMTKNPRYGYGKNLNACIDCRILTIACAKRVMEEQKADFLVSGEVIGQRPKSQTRSSMLAVDKAVRELGIGGLFLRPLSAKLLDPTVPEQQGWVDREQLYDFAGRGRNAQMELAGQIGLVDYPGPGGGCLLTDPGYCRRLKDLIDHHPQWGAQDARILKVGRLIRIDDESVIIASRNNGENKILISFARESDLLVVTAVNPGAVILLRGPQTEERVRIAAGLAVHYSKNRLAGRAPVRTSGTETPKLLGEFDRVDPSEAGQMFRGD